MKEVEKISSYTGVSEEAAYKLFLNGYSVPNELAGQQIAFSEDKDYSGRRIPGNRLYGLLT